jgi:hypothetical protein
MTEAEWLACTDPQKMLEFLRGRASDRKLLLFVADTARAMPPMPVFEQEDVAKMYERVAEGQLTEDDFARWSLRHLPGMRPPPGGTLPDKWEVARRGARERYRYAPLAVTRPITPESGVGDNAAMSDVLRCIFGNPFRPVALDPAWLTWHAGAGTVPALAQSAYEDRQLPSGHLDPHRLAVLADALEDAGCDDVRLLGHLRSSGPHVRGCWVVDMLLGKG